MSISIKKIESWASKNKTSKLIKAANTGGLDIRTAAIKALGTFKDESVMHLMISFLKDTNKSIRAAAVDALGAMANIRSLEFVRQLWTSEQDEEVREKAKEAIAKIKANTTKTEIV